MVELVVRLVLSLGIVLGLLVLVARVGAKRFRGSSGSMVHVVHRQALSRSSAIAVVTVGSRVLVLGTTEQQVQLLTELDPEELLDPALIEAPAAATAAAPEMPAPQVSAPQVSAPGTQTTAAAWAAQVSSHAALSAVGAATIPPAPQSASKGSPQPRRDAGEGAAFGPKVFEPVAFQPVQAPPRPRLLDPQTTDGTGPSSIEHDDWSVEVADDGAICLEDLVEQTEDLSVLERAPWRVEPRGTASDALAGSLLSAQTWRQAWAAATGKDRAAS